MMSQAAGASAAYAPQLPPAEILVSRLDQIDHRLRQLEEKHRLPFNNTYGQCSSGDSQMPTPRTAPQHHPSRSFSSALQESQPKGSIMDRLRLLESRIQQLSFQLDNKTSGHAAAAAVGTSAMRQMLEDVCPVEQAAPAMAVAKQPEGGADAAVCSSRAAGGGPWTAAEIFQRGARELSRLKPTRSSKVKDPCKDALLIAESRAARCNCGHEKKRLEHTRFYKRWFAVGC